MTINYQKHFKELADRLAREPSSGKTLERSILRHLWAVDDPVGHIARAKRERATACWRFSEAEAFRRHDGNSPGTMWAAFDAITEHLDFGRRGPDQPDATVVRGHGAEAARSIWC